MNYLKDIYRLCELIIKLYLIAAGWLVEIINCYFIL